jgi:hypothetical protein
LEAAIDPLGGAATGSAGRFLAVTLVLAATVQANVDERNRMRLGFADERRRVHGGLFSDFGEEIQESAPASGFRLHARQTGRFSTGTMQEEGSASRSAMR